MRITYVAWIAGFLIGLAALVGCDSNTLAELKGTVKVDGKLVEKGAISFVPEDGKAQTAGGPIKDGQYSAKVPVGVMKVTISAPKEVGRKKLYDTPDSPDRPIYSETLPPEYTSMQETTLKFDVKPGKNQKDWDLQSK